MAKRKISKDAVVAEQSETKQSENMRELAVPVSQKVQIVDVKVNAVSAKKLSSQVSEASEVTVEFQCKTIAEDSLVRVTVNAEVYVTDDADQRFLEVISEHELLYSTPPNEYFAENNLEAFGTLNGMYNLWPYLRELVQSMTIRIGMPPLTLPVFRPTGQRINKMVGRVKASNLPNKKSTRKKSK
ncbi:hypothetical protein [Rosistilla oblonga]|uniref:hypothetical protein n=1 Tax=Rosistilla oblonga TaxID=2527990 RepID=UPI003A973875